MSLFCTTVIIPAHDEEAWLPRCLEALLAQDASTGVVEVIIAANACRDGTVPLALSFAPRMAARGWRLVVLDLTEGGKLNALNQAERVASGRNRIYLDADVTLEPGLLGQIRAALAVEAPRYATGTIAVAPGQTWATRRYAEVWQRLPFVTGGAVGAGFFAVNAAGRARWGDFPAIISDDTFVRLQFAPGERVEVSARYHWPMVEGLANLVKVRRRQDAGVAELRRLAPELFANEAKPPLTAAGLARIAAAAPLGFLVYLLVHLAVWLRPGGSAWTRGR